MKLKKLPALLLAIMMTLSNIAPAFAAEATDQKINYPTSVNNGKEVKPYVLKDGEDLDKLLESPDYPKLYTYRWDYMVPLKDENGDVENKVGYQPYIASVGENATDDQKAKVKKTINLPEMDGYDKPGNSYDVSYDGIVAGATKQQTEWDFSYYGHENFVYKAQKSKMKVKYVFQRLDDLEEYDNPKGYENDGLIKEFDVETGQTFVIEPLGDEYKEITKGFYPEQTKLKVVVPENAKDAPFIYYYNREKYNITFDTDDGTYVPNLTLYYGQTIPYVDDVPVKEGATFKYWTADSDIVMKDGTTIKAGSPIDMKQYKNGIKNAMPAKNVKFEAVWEEEENADYTVLFWTEKADYDKSKTELRDRYDYVGAKVIKGAKTGSHPDLTTISKEGIGFPDLEGRLEEVLKDEDRFAKFYFLNKDLTNKVNASEKDPAVVKEVSSTGKTVYNVYYDRRVYTLYFTRTVFDLQEGFFPNIKRSGTYIGGSKSPTGKAYSEKVRFGQDLSKIWPIDNQIEFPEDNGGLGWVINTNYDAEDIDGGCNFCRLSSL